MKKISIFLLLLLFTACSLFQNQITKSEEKITTKTENGVTTSSRITSIWKEDIKMNENPIPPATITVTENSFSPKSKLIPTVDGRKFTLSSKITNIVKPLRFDGQLTETNDPNSSDAFQSCYTRKVKIDATSSNYMIADYASQSQHILPGMIYDYDDFIMGNYSEYPISRNEIVLSTDNPTIQGSSYITIQNPKKITLRDGVSQLFSRFNDVETGTMNLRYQTYQVSSMEEAILRLYGKAVFKSLASSSIENEYYNKDKYERHYITVDVIKPLYSISSEKNVTTYFKNNLPNKQVDGIEVSANPIMIKSVTYGLRILANLEIETKTEEEWNKFKAKYNSPFLESNLDFDYIKNSKEVKSTINCYVVGGMGKSTISFTKEEFQKQLQDLVAGVTYKTARPISYTLSDLKDNLIETTSSTDEITTMYCLPNDNPKLQSIVMIVNSGDDGKDGDSAFSILINKGRTTIAKFTNEVDVNRDINYPNETATQRELTLQSGANQYRYNDLINSGGKVVLAISPVRNDTWKINSLKINFIFENEKVESLTFSNLVLSDETKLIELFYKKGFVNQ